MTGRKGYLRYVAALSLSLLCGACGKQHNDTHQDTCAPAPITKMAVAQAFGLYVSQNYDAYVDAMLSCDGQPESYRKSMATLMHQHAAEQTAVQGKVVDFSVDSIQISSSGRAAEAYLSVAFSNGNTETQLLQFVFDGHRWRLR